MKFRLSHLLLGLLSLGFVSLQRVAGESKRFDPDADLLSLHYDHAPDQDDGGGVVHVPAGRYLTGTVRLLSHVTLEIEAGAALLGSENPDDYPDVADPWEPHGTGHPATAPLIYAEDAENITITGRGTINGQGAIWWHRVRLNNPTKYPPGPRNDEDRAEAAKLSKNRPNLIRLVRCDDVVIERVNLIDSPSWTVG